MTHTQLIERLTPMRRDILIRARKHGYICANQHVGVSPVIVNELIGRGLMVGRWLGPTLYASITDNGRNALTALQARSNTNA